ncbi:hypothetical protein ACQP3L_33745, partial [Escherichia coli]
MLISDPSDSPDCKKGFKTNQPTMGAGKMSGKCLLCKHEDTSLIPQHPHKKTKQSKKTKHDG